MNHQTFMGFWCLLIMLSLMLCTIFTQTNNITSIINIQGKNKEYNDHMLDGKSFFDQVVHIPQFSSSKIQDVVINKQEKTLLLQPCLKNEKDQKYVEAHQDEPFDFRQLPSVQEFDFLIQDRESKVSPVIVVLVHLGYHLPEHVIDCIDQLRIWKGDQRRQYRFILVCNTEDVKFQASQIPDLEIYMYQYPVEEFQTMHKKSPHHALFQWSIIRFHALLLCMKQWHLKQVIHIEHDNLIYAPLDDLFDLCQQACGTKLGLTPDHVTRVIGGFVFVGSIEALEKFHFQCQEQKFSQIDMFALSTFLNQQPDYAYALPVMPTEWHHTNDVVYNKLNENASQFRVGIFDAAAAGQWIGGIDVIHSNDDTRGFINETAMYQSNVVWTKDEMQRLTPVYPMFSSTDGSIKYYRYFNLHIHCKKLHRYMSWPSVPAYDIIQGERFRDLYFQQPFFMSFHYQEDFDTWQPPSSWHPNLIIYIKGDLIPRFFQKIWPVIPQNVQLILISHNADFEITENYRSYLNTPQLRWWFGQNVQIQHPKLVPLPIGVANSEFPHGNTRVLDQMTKTTWPFKKNMLYVNFTATHSDRAEIRTALEQAAKLGAPIWFDQGVDYKTYLKNMSSCKYVACVRGNGTDTHRLWETLYCGSIPVTYEKIMQQYDWLPDHMVPQYKADTLEWHLPQNDQFWHVGHGHLYWRLSYWKYRIYEHLSITPHHQMDVLLLVHQKDLPTLKECVRMLQENLWELRKIYIVTAVSKHEMQNFFSSGSGPFVSLDQLVILDENNMDDTRFPFTLGHVKERMPNVGKRAGWYFQQLCKMHADCLPNILPWILVMDADTMLTRRMRFRSMDGLTLFSTTSGVHAPYSQHMKRVLPSAFEHHDEVSGISHHMLFHQPILKDLRQQIELYWHTKPNQSDKKCWHILLDQVDVNEYHKSGMSEYEMYFHFMKYKYADQMDTRPLWHLDVKHKDEYERLLKYRNCQMFSAHEWQRTF